MWIRCAWGFSKCTGSSRRPSIQFTSGGSHARAVPYTIPRPTRRPTKSNTPANMRLSEKEATFWAFFGSGGKLGQTGRACHGLCIEVQNQRGSDSLTPIQCFRPPLIQNALSEGYISSRDRESKLRPSRADTTGWVQNFGVHSLRLKEGSNLLDLIQFPRKDDHLFHFDPFLFSRRPIGDLLPKL